jgi:hypothetical protein
LAEASQQYGENQQYKASQKTIETQLTEASLSNKENHNHRAQNEATASN